MYPEVNLTTKHTSMFIERQVDSRLRARKDLGYPKTIDYLSLAGTYRLNSDLPHIEEAKTDLRVQVLQMLKLICINLAFRSNMQ